MEQWLCINVLEIILEKLKLKHKYIFGLGYFE